MIDLDKLPSSREIGLKLGSFFYYTGKPCVNGHDRERYVDCSTCAGCREMHSKNRSIYRRLDDLIAEEYNLSQRQYRLDNPKKALLYPARRRAKLKGLEFSITEEDIIIPTHCPVLGYELCVGNSRLSFQSPSLDRIDNNLGYTKGNVIVVSHKANSIKCNATVDELERVYLFYRKLNESK